MYFCPKNPSMPYILAQILNPQIPYNRGPRQYFTNQKKYSSRNHQLFYYSEHTTIPSLHRCEFNFFYFVRKRECYSVFFIKKELQKNISVFFKKETAALLLQTCSPGRRIHRPDVGRAAAVKVPANPIHSAGPIRRRQQTHVIGNVSQSSPPSFLPLPPGFSPQFPLLAPRFPPLTCKLQPGFNFPAENRRKTGKFSVSASSREMEFRYFSPFFVFKFKNSKIFVKNWKKI